MADIDKIVKSANNFYNSKVTTEGRGRFWRSRESTILLLVDMLPIHLLVDG